ncbi:MAG: diguanylate cyclase [Spirochaetales bacterium]|nr:diguanylate cyclase [Spirochaetales bacterium]
MKLKAEQIRYHFIIMLLFFLSMIFLVTYAFLFKYFKETEHQIYDSHIEKLQDDYLIMTGGYTSIANLIFRSSIQTDDVLNILDKLDRATEESVKDAYRQELNAELDDVYAVMKSYGFRQLHFHDSRNISIYRFHKPEKYGDDLTGIRYSVEYVNTNREMISGFEEGRIFNGYRNVYPLERNRRHIGSVELSISMAAITQQIESKFKQESQFILLKSVVDKKVFDSEQANYTAWSVDDSYVLDVNISPTCFLENTITPGESGQIRTALAAARADEEPFSLRIRNKMRSNVLTFLPVYNFEKEVVGFLFTAADDKSIRSQTQSFMAVTTAFAILMLLSLIFMYYFSITNRKIQNMIQYDLLTKAYTRRLIFQKLEEEHQRFLRYGNTYSACMIDIDHFKKINDQYGHQTGDSVLAELSRIIMSRIRQSDEFGRYGGEEFLLLMPETELETAARVMENIRVIIEKHSFSLVGHITVSAGLAEADSNLEKTADLVEQADSNLYTAKKKGRNRVFPSPVSDQNQDQKKTV